MDPVQAALYAVAVPAAVAAGVLFALHVFTTKRAAATGVGPAIALGFIVAFIGMAGRPAFPPKEAWHWLPFLAAAAAAIGGIEPRIPGFTRRGLRIALLVFAALAVTPPSKRDPAQGELYVSAGTALAALVASRYLEALEKTGGPRAALAPAFVASACAAIALAVFSGSAVLGTLCGAVAAAIGACLVLGWWIPIDARDGSLVAVSLVAMTSLCGAQYATLPAASSILLAVAPAGGALTVGLLARRGGPMRLVLRAAGGAAIPAGIAVAIAAHYAPRFDY